MKLGQTLDTWENIFHNSWWFGDMRGKSIFTVYVSLVPVHVSNIKLFILSNSTTWEDEKVKKKNLHKKENHTTQKRYGVVEIFEKCLH